MDTPRPLINWIGKSHNDIDIDPNRPVSGNMNNAIEKLRGRFLSSTQFHLLQSELLQGNRSFAWLYVHVGNMRAARFRVREYVCECVRAFACDCVCG